MGSAMLCAVCHAVSAGGLSAKGVCVNRVPRIPRHPLPEVSSPWAGGAGGSACACLDVLQGGTEVCPAPRAS